MKRKDKIRGCLIGGAVGDALGYAVEFMSETDIRTRYGTEGIIEYSLTNGIARISDDTQMTLFTADGLLLCGARVENCGTALENISLCYKDWFRTQTERYPLKGGQTFSRLINVPELFSRRAPGNTCLSAIRAGAAGTIEKPINNSKGCGGIMRAAPIGLYFFGGNIKQDEIDMLGARSAALTHGHELGYIPTAVFVHIISRLTAREYNILAAVNDAGKAVKRLFPDAKHVDEMLLLLNRATELSCADISDSEAIKQLGEGWTAEETLAIAVYCSLKYSDDFDKAIVAAVNHDGDSDSTGAVTGNIMGARLGLSDIPAKYTDTLELKEVILEVADRLSDSV